MDVVSWKNTLKFLPLAVVVTLSFAIAAIFLTVKTPNAENLVFLKQQEKVIENGTFTAGCNYFTGRWVYDDVSYPLYEERQCSLSEDDFSCEKNGRKNLRYQHWRWQPHQCHLPKFNGTMILEKLRNKKMVYVGDSLNRNQWRSFLCLIEPYLPPSTNKTTITDKQSINLYVKDYNATITFYWSPFLVESNKDSYSDHSGSAERWVRLKSIEKNGREWINADILIFDTFAWWIIPNLTLLWGSFNSRDTVYKQMNTSLRHYEIVLNTWSDWLEYQVHPNQTKLYFMSASPYGLGRTVWGCSPRCYNATDPISDERYWGNAVEPSLMDIVGSTIERLQQRGVKVQFMNITQLSGYREDAHVSIYRPFSKSKGSKDVFTPHRYTDCIHWCLPGVPDVWNQILYAYIMN